MRVGIDCRTILNPDGGEQAGIGHYTYHLVSRLIDLDPQVQFVLFFDYRMAREAGLEYQRPNVRLRFFPFSSYGKFLPFAYSHLLVAASLYKSRVDVFHAPANTLPLAYAKPSVVTVHDLAIYRHPEWFPSQIFSTRLLVPQSLKAARKIIAVSECTKNDLRALFNVPDDKVAVIHEAANTELLHLHDQADDVRMKYSLPERYVLYVGTLEVRKNIVTLLEAWQRLQLMRPASLGGAHLVLAGGVGYQGQRILKAIADLKLEPTVHHLGYVSHNHKVKLLQGASAFVYPSLYEGFGIPVLEAMQLGVPVITTKTSSLPEITGPAALLVEPSDVEGMAQAIKRVMTDANLAQELAAQGQRRAQEFSWDRAARETLNVYRQAAG